MERSALLSRVGSRLCTSIGAAQRWEAVKERERKGPVAEHKEESTTTTQHSSRDDNNDDDNNSNRNAERLGGGLSRRSPRTLSTKKREVGKAQRWKGGILLSLSSRETKRMETKRGDWRGRRRGLPVFFPSLGVLRASTTTNDSALLEGEWETRT